MKKTLYLAVLILVLIKSEMTWGQKVDCRLVKREITSLCNQLPQETHTTSCEDNSTEILLQRIDAFSNQQEALLQRTVSNENLTEILLGRIDALLQSTTNNENNSTEILLQRIDALSDQREALLHRTTSEDNSTEILLSAISAFSDQLNTLQQRLDMLYQLGSSLVRPASSCAEILEEYPDSSSGYYWVSNATGHAHSVYCDMTRSCGGVTGGWMRVAYLDMTNSSHQCPSSLHQRTHSGVRSCAVKSNSGSCSFVWYLPQGIPYSSVCGRILGYYDKSTDGFYQYDSTKRPTSPNINSNYVDGVSLTYGNTNKHHIWTFVSTSVLSYAPQHCNCGTPPSFVNSHYFCDAHLLWSTNVDNPLWDGEGCGSRSCCHLHNPPWFYRHLPQTTTEDIEMRLCRDQSRGDEDVMIGVVEIYVQ